MQTGGVSSRVMGRTEKLARPRKAGSGRREGLQGLEITAQVAPRKLLPTRPMPVWGPSHSRQSTPIHSQVSLAGPSSKRVPGVWGAGLDWD